MGLRPNSKPGGLALLGKAYLCPPNARPPMLGGLRKRQKAYYISGGLLAMLPACAKLCFLLSYNQSPLAPLFKGGNDERNNNNPPY